MTRFVRTTLSLLTALALTAAVAQGAGGGAHHGHGAPSSGSMSGGMMMTPPAGGMGMGPGAGHAMTSAAVDELSFLQHMIPHHQEAIDSAAALLDVTRRPELRALLEDVIAIQAAEVALMRGWIAEGYPGEPEEMDYVPMMRDLSGASVADRERAWLEDMVMHHMMAVHDARSLLVGGWATRPEVAQLAVDIIQGQMAEIHLMRGWLAAWFGGDATAMGRGGMGMGGMGMHGAQGAAAGRGPAPFDASAVEALARAFLAGAGGGDVVELHGPTVTFHVAVLVDGVERALVVDASTGEVRWDDER
jgi:uncharacterized protein (DUF305 family)